MIYLDYAANTPVDKRVLKVFDDATIKYIANPNSSHDLGKLAKEEIDKVSSNISKYFDTNKENIIYTSGASESNNLIIKGVAEKAKGKHIIISAVEHSSVIAPCNYLTNLGYDVSIIPLTKEGVIDLDVLKKEINDDTILVSICSVDSELGTIQPIEEVAKIVKEYKNCIFHTDATQAIGKIKHDYSDVDFITFAPHKFFGLNGFGVLVNKNNKKITPIIHGGKSTTIYRSGTPVTANVLALNEAFNLAINNLD
ncbi:MAG: aminotransferase class V-fold PLP-dependent enzyme [Bacilli bacterium]|nr:aminotransferase class V-fold PLP-dependent enzyme [Bacilli bacterium]